MTVSIGGGNILTIVAKVYISWYGHHEKFVEFCFLSTHFFHFDSLPSWESNTGPVFGIKIAKPGLA